MHPVWEWASEGGSPSGPMLFPNFEGDTGWIISKTESALQFLLLWGSLGSGQPSMCFQWMVDQLLAGFPNEGMAVTLSASAAIHFSSFKPLLTLDGNRETN